MTEKQASASVTRPSANRCICGEYQYGERAGWLRNWCGNQCCWNEETCRKCGRVYSAMGGVLVRGGRRG